MFGLDFGKMILVGAIALVVIKPEDLPAALRFAGRAVAQLRRLRNEVFKLRDSLLAETSLDSEISAIAGAARVNLALNPATAMRGNLLRETPAVEEPGFLEYASPEMQAYLAPVSEPGTAPTLAAPAGQEARECVSPSL